MKNLVRSLALAGFVLSCTLPVNADDYVSSFKYKVNGCAAPAKTVLIDKETKVIENAAVVEGTCSNVKIQSAVVGTPCATTIRTQPVVVENLVKKKAHLFHIGLWPVVDFSLF